MMRAWYTFQTLGRTHERLFDWRVIIIGVLSVFATVVTYFAVVAIWNGIPAEFDLVPLVLGLTLGVSAIAIVPSLILWIALRALLLRHTDRTSQSIDRICAVVVSGLAATCSYALIFDGGSMHDFRATVLLIGTPVVVAVLLTSPILHREKVVASP